MEDSSNSRKISRRSAFHLKHERELRGWTQSEVAERIGTTQINVSRWEKGTFVPSPYYRQRLSELFRKSIQELGLIGKGSEEQETETSTVLDTSTSRISHESTSFLPVWHVPYRRNPFFTGREDILAHLHTALKSGKTASLTQAQAISGLGGIGKTQIAIEYAYRYHDDYEAIFCINASTLDTLRNDFMTLAMLLNLSERYDPEQDIVVWAVKHWLTTHTHWLLILDNVDDLEMITKFLPEYGMGEVLLTTRLQALGTIAQSIEVKTMAQEEGVTFLLRRIKAIAPGASFEQATSDVQAQAAGVVAELDGLPLALDQAGAYIEETRCGLSQYNHRYNARRKDLLLRRGRFPMNHPDSVATTWSLSFHHVKQKSEAAAELLCLLAFLDPESISEEFLTLGAIELGPVLGAAARDPLQLDYIIELLLCYSLIQRNGAGKSLSVHRLVQVVLKDSMDWDTQRLWAERAIRAVNDAFPDVELHTWERCQQCLPHVEICTTYIKEYALAFPEAARLFNEAASYLIIHGRYDYAESMLHIALELRQNTLEASHPDTARTLNDLGVLYLKQGKYQEAEPLLQKAMTFRQRVLGEKHPAVAETLSNLASSYYARADYTKAEPFYLQALTILEDMSEIAPALVAQSYYSLAKLYHSQEKYQQAQTLLEKALNMQKDSLGESHPSFASTLTMLAKVYQEQNEFAQAERMSIRALMIRETISGSNHPHVATILNNLVEVYHAQGRYDEAVPSIARSLRIHEQSLGPDHPYMAYSLSNQAENSFSRGDYTQAESSYKKALDIREQHLGFNHPRTASTYYHLAQLYVTVERFEEAEVFYRNALSIWEHTFGPDHPAVIRVLEQYANLLRRLKRVSEAQKLEARIPTTGAR
jgi:tetratricopeptide (TPR) repeat protein/DNA-binding XRE family transcriptional regulator